MELYNWIMKNQFQKWNRLTLIAKSSVNKRWKAIIKEKLKEPET